MRGMNMMRRGWVLAAILGVAGGCSSDETVVATSMDEAVREDERAPAKLAGWCTKCNMFVHDSHRCGLTMPCALCKREAGARHLHEVVWVCEIDETVMAVQHECLDAKFCTTCRADKRSLLGPKGCERCARLTPAQKIQGITFYCRHCNLETGANHVCGKTRYCYRCLRESGKNHRCDATRYCPDHEEEHAPDHVHGTTTYCARCHRDAGENHVHGVSEWCWTCHDEVEWPHCHH